MKKFLLFASAFAFIALIFVLCTGGQQPADNSKEETVTASDPVADGKYLITIMGCHDCHSPKRMTEKGPQIIEELAWSGYPADRELPDLNTDLLPQGWGMVNEDFTVFVGPWGVSFSANISSDNTGIGTWTEEQFKLAIKEGWYKGVPNSRKLLPPMPYENFADMTDEDLHALFMYLKSTKPVSNVPPQPIPPEQK